MLALIPAAIGALGAGFNYLASKNNANAAKNAANAYTDQARQQGQIGEQIVDRYDWQKRLDAANQLRQDANDYEIRQATQSALAAYGGDPLSSGARNLVQDRAQQVARGNWQQALDNANGMLGTDMSNRLASHNITTGHIMTGAGNAANAAAAQPSTMSTLLGGAGQALDLYSKVKRL